MIFSNVQSFRKDQFKILRQKMSVYGESELAEIFVRHSNVYLQQHEKSAAENYNLIKLKTRQGDRK